MANLAKFSDLQRSIAGIADDGARRQAIVGLVTGDQSWAELGIGLDLAVQYIGEPSEAECAAMRAAFARIHAEPVVDRMGLMRTAAIRVLSRTPGSADMDTLVEASYAYLWVDGGTIDAGAEMRGLALRGMAAADPAAGRWAAARLLFDGEVPDQEPQRTAVSVLAAHGDHPLLLRWIDDTPGPRPADAAAAAEAELTKALPARVWTERALLRLGDRSPVETMAAFDAVVLAVRTDVAPGLEALLLGVSDPDLFRALAMMLATSRELAFQDVLMGLGETLSLRMLDAYTDSLAVSRDPRKEKMLDRVTERARAGV